MDFDIDTEFTEFPKISRLSREVIVTEKIDGTNSQIRISDDGNEISAGSRTRWITPADDNKGFANWVLANKTELLRLGPGSHFGEWWAAVLAVVMGLRKSDLVYSISVDGVMKRLGQSVVVLYLSFGVVISMI